MIKRIIAASAAAFIILSLCGCGSILEGETSVITPYEGTEHTVPDEDSTKKISTYSEFIAAVKLMVNNYTETQTFSISDFDTEDIENALPDACQKIALEDPLCSYAVYYISCEVTPIVSRYDVKVSIVYKRSAEEIANVVSVYSDRYLQYALLSSMQNYDESCAIYTSLDSITAEYILATIQEQYYKSPLSVVIAPTVDVSTYPSGEGERIMDVSLSYGFSKNVLVSMTNRMNASAQSIVERVGGTDDYVLLSALCEELHSSVSYRPESTSDLSATAYGALVGKSATSEGFSMAFKALCDKMGIDCVVVSGKYNGEDHFWNIVTFSGLSYHVDTTAYTPEGGFLKSDHSMRDDYWWDSSMVPECPSDYTLVSADAALPTVGADDTVPIR